MYIHNEGPAATIRDTKPYSDSPSRAMHNDQMRAIWQRIRIEAAADDGIPVALFSPPCMYTEVRIAEWPRAFFCCPCDIRERDCEFIPIRAPKDSEHGITKDMFIQQITEALYGRDPDASGDEQGGQQPESHVQGTRHDGYTIGDEEDRPVINAFTYMISAFSMPTASGGEPLMGDIFALTRGIKENHQESDSSDED
ncbi:hypothetical protein GGR53DRAFT_480257 [Hypoxylon sp. FL1150]|nr:hypothetical protein GGR53DRAFT_480257 [Hypoxylon sp. FL1150]